MSFESLVQVSSQSLEKLQAELLGLAEDLQNCYDLLSTDMTNLHEAWRDEKYDEFEREFKSRKDQIHDIAEKYKNWANGYLAKKIEEIKIVEGSTVQI